MCLCKLTVNSWVSSQPNFQFFHSNWTLLFKFNFDFILLRLDSNNCFPNKIVILDWHEDSHRRNCFGEWCNCSILFGHTLIHQPSISSLVWHNYETTFLFNKMGLFQELLDGILERILFIIHRVIASTQWYIKETSLQSLHMSHS